MKIKLGIAPIAWSNDDMPELGGDTPIEDCLLEANLAGFTGIELGGKFPRNPGIIKFLLNKYKLHLPGGWYGSNLRIKSVNEEWSSMQDQIKLLKILNADIFVFADVTDSIQSDKKTQLSKRPKLDKEEWKSYCHKISEISTRLDDVGLPMSYHSHMGTIIQTEKDVDQFIELTNDKTYFLFDSGHLLFAQADYENLLKNYISRINHIHFKDIRKDILNISLDNDLSFRESFLKGVFTVPGDGSINYKPLIETIYQNGYENWIVVEAEQDPAKANPFEYAKIGYKYLEEIVIKVGYQIN